MNKNPQAPIPIQLKGSEQVIFTVPAQPKPKPPWLIRNADGLLAIWGCLMLALYIYFWP